VPAPEQILSNPEFFAQYIDGDKMVRRNLNLGRSASRGIDYDLQGRQPTAWGRLFMGLKGVRMLKSARQMSAQAPFVSNLGTISDAVTAMAVRDQLTLSARLEQSDWSAGAALHYRSGNTEQLTLVDAQDQPLDHSRRVPGWWTLDLSGRWQLSRALSLSAHVINATDRLPPLRLAMPENVLLGIDTRYGNYFGRTLRLKGDYKF